MKLSTLNAIINAFNTASNDATRYHLNHVRVTAYGPMVQVEASDGYMLSDVRVEDKELAELIGSTVYAVSPDALPGLKQAAKLFKTMGRVASRLGDKDALELVTGPSVIRIDTAREANIQFPDFNQVKPKHPEDSFSISLNPELLLDLLKALQEDKRSTMATLTFGKDPMSPIAVEVSGQQGVLMPMRGPKSKTKASA